MDIAVFLSARWDEIEALAQRTKAAYVVRVSDPDLPPLGTPIWPPPALRRYLDSDDDWVAGVDLIRTLGPQFVLADIASKRAILAEYTRWQAQAVATRADADYRSAYTDALEYVLGSFTQPFAAHPDFDPAWAVTTAADDGPPSRSDLMEAVIAAIPADEHGQPETVWYSPVGELVFYAPPGVPARVERADSVVDIGLPWAEQVRIALTFDDGCICVGDDLRYRPEALVRGFTTSTSVTVRCRREMP